MSNSDPEADSVDHLKQMAELEKQIERLQNANNSYHENLDKLRAAHRHDLTRAQFEIAGLKAEVDRLTPKYTRDLPTAPGFYWNKDDDGNETIVKVRRGDDGLQSFLFESEIGLPLANLGGQWVGPLTKPEAAP